MLIGLISDTHGKLRTEVFDKLAGVDRILHAGDVGRVDILTELESIAPVTAVWGNTDDFDVRARTQKLAWLELDGRKTLVVHGHQVGAPTPQRLRDRYPDADIIVYGHTHQAMVDESEGKLVVNPGAAGQPRFGLPLTVARLRLDGGEARVEVIPLDGNAPGQLPGV